MFLSGWFWVPDLRPAARCLALVAGSGHRAIGAGPGLHLAADAGPLRTPAALNWRRELARDQPIVAVSSSSILSLAFFDARGYSRASFLVASFFVAIDDR